MILKLATRVKYKIIRTATILKIVCVCVCVCVFVSRSNNFEKILLLLYMCVFMVFCTMR
ncbi:hypothetical protein BY996DRAFT_7400389 [Phakopsora pachyrhizi]|nr:hypothetical protein BY996DRAFT_7400389 [Phakopsora pachyrhizi]